MKIIDAHLHYNAAEPQDLQLLEELDLQLLNICVTASPGPSGWHREQAEPYARHARRWPHRYAWCTTFDLPAYPLKDRDYPDRVIARLDRDFAAGAVACKVWKDLGMELRDETDRYVMIDDPLFEPIFSHLERIGRPLLGHLAEPIACWRPLTPASPHYNYYSTHPQWHMHGKTGLPTHGEILAARDRVIERHPNLPFIGAHLGSHETDLPALADRFDRFPNFAADTSARLADLAWQDPSKVRAFIERYPDRLLWGSDVAAGPWLGGLNLTPASLAANAQPSRDNLRWAVTASLSYFRDALPLTIARRQVPALSLPSHLLQNLFHDNARRWYPALFNSTTL